METRSKRQTRRFLSEAPGFQLGDIQALIDDSNFDFDLQDSNMTVNSNSSSITSISFLNIYDVDHDLSNQDSKKLYLKAIAVDSDVQKYDLSPSNFEMFLCTLREKINDFKLNRNNNFSLDKNHGAAGTTPEYVILLDYYGDVDLTHVYNKSRDVWYGKHTTI